jgi:N-acetylglucosamine kinase-like BadF-type ATPase
MRRTLRALDGLEKATPLNEAVCAHLATRDPAILAEAARRQAEAEGRGFLVPLVLENARRGDEEAKNLFVGAAGWLAAQSRVAYTQLSFDEATPVPVAMIGGLWEAGDLITDPFHQLIERWMPRAAAVSPDAAPVIGAARLAQRALTRYTPPP